MVRLVRESQTQKGRNQDANRDLKLNEHWSGSSDFGGRDLVHIERNEEGEGSSWVATDEAATEEERHVEEAGHNGPDDGDEIEDEDASETTGLDESKSSEGPNEGTHLGRGTDYDVVGLPVGRRPGKPLIMKELHEYFTNGAVYTERVAILKGAKSDGYDVEVKSDFRIRRLCFEELVWLIETIIVWGIPRYNSRLLHY